MTDSKNPVVIIGNCAAAVYAIEAFREHNKNTPIYGNKQRTLLGILPHEIVSSSWRKSNGG
ncbi:MAG: hypothetical protein PWQ97_51 [Tepidanaerobacteraceae bacterium]|nr:hypothetical protein [Tepidanaerobacteraceae bacterium]